MVTTVEHDTISSDYLKLGELLHAFPLFIEIEVFAVVCGDNGMATGRVKKELRDLAVACFTRDLDLYFPMSVSPFPASSVALPSTSKGRSRSIRKRRLVSRAMIRILFETAISTSDAGS